jgi:hypothetical protein
MPHQPLDRPTPEPINPALRRVAAQRSWNWAVFGSPRCGCRGESQRAGDTNPGLSWGRLFRRLDRCDRHWLRSQGSLSQWHDLRVAFTNGSIAWLAQPVARPACGIHQWINRMARSASGTTCVWHSPMDQSQGSLSQWHDLRVAFTNGSIARLAQPVARPACGIHQWINRKARSARWHEEASAWGSSPSRLCVLGRSLSHATDQESHPLPDPAAARRCGGRRPVIRC